MSVKETYTDGWYVVWLRNDDKRQIVEYRGGVWLECGEGGRICEQIGKVEVGPFTPEDVLEKLLGGKAGEHPETATPDEFEPEPQPLDIPIGGTNLNECSGPIKPSGELLDKADRDLQAQADYRETHAGASRPDTKAENINSHFGKTAEELLSDNEGLPKSAEPTTQTYIDMDGGEVEVHFNESKDRYGVCIIGSDCFYVSTRSWPNVKKALRLKPMKEQSEEVECWRDTVGWQAKEIDRLRTELQNEHTKRIIAEQAKEIEVKARLLVESEQKIETLRYHLKQADNMPDDASEFKEARLEGGIGLPKGQVKLWVGEDFVWIIDHKFGKRLEKQLNAAIEQRNTIEILRNYTTECDSKIAEQAKEIEGLKKELDELHLLRGGNLEALLLLRAKLIKNAKEIERLKAALRSVEDVIDVAVQEDIEGCYKVIAEHVVTMKGK